MTSTLGANLLHATGRVTFHVAPPADEREFLLRWLQHDTTSPVTREALHKDLRRNYAIKHTIEDWLKVCPCRWRCRHFQGLIKQLLLLSACRLAFQAPSVCVLSMGGLRQVIVTMHGS